MDSYAYNIQFLPGIGLGTPPSDIPALEGNTIIIPFPSNLYADGYEFTHWVIQDSFDHTSGVYKSGDVFIMPDHDVTFIAYFAYINTIVIRYNQDGYDLPPTQTIVTIDNPYLYTIPIDYQPKKESAYNDTTRYEFLGYSLRDIYNETDVIYQPGDDVPITNSVMLYPHYKPILVALYDMNGGYPDIIDVNEYTTGLIAYVSSTIPTKKGMTFTRYTANPNPCEVATTFRPGDAFSFYRPHGIYFHAEYVNNEYKIRYHIDPDDPTNIYEMTGVYGTSYLIPTSIVIDPHKTGHIFTGWYLQGQDSVLYKEGESFILDDHDMDFYPYFVRDKYRISYDVGRGNLIPESAEVMFDELYILTSDIPEIPNSYLVFDHWIDITTNIQYEPADVFKMPSRNVIFQAVYTDRSCVVSFNLNGGDGTTPPSQTVAKGELFTLNDGVIIDTFYNNGYTFLGWSFEANAVNPEYTFGSTIALFRDTVLYAVWKINTYHIYYNKNATDTVSNMPETQDGVYNSSVLISDKTPSRLTTLVEYIFGGWSETPTDDDTIYTPGNFIKIPAYDVTLYAIWNQKFYDFELKFDSTIGIGAPNDITLTLDNKTTSITIPTTVIPMKENYIFLGWDIDTTVSNPRYSPGDIITISSGTTILYAIWRSTITYNYEVVFDSTLGDDGPDTLLFATEVEQVFETNIPEKTPRLDGYVFNGWYSTDYGKYFYPNDPISVPEPGSVILKAQWIMEELSYRLVLDWNNGADDSTILTYVGRESTHIFTLPTTIPTRDGYEFYRGWSDDDGNYYMPGGATKEYAPGINQLHANWKIKEYKISYNVNGGTNRPANTTAYYQSTIELSRDVPTRQRYLFEGWYTADNPNKLYQPGDNYTIYNTVVFIARWKEDEVYIYYDTGNSSTAIEPISGSYGQIVSLSSITPVRDSESFLGWSKVENDASMLYKAGSQFVIDSINNIILYAIYDDIQSHIFFDQNGGILGPIEQEGMDGETINISTEIPYYRGHKFLGWALEKESSHIDYFPGDEITLTINDIMLYAQWEELESIFSMFKKIGNQWKQLPFFQ